MAYRISLTGAQGTGKSTVADAIVTRLRKTNIGIVQSCASVGVAVGQSGLATGATAGAETVRTFAKLLQEREATATGRVQVFDRCLLDTLAYAQVLDCLPADEVRVLRLATIESCRRAAQLLWLRVTVDYPVRSHIDETPEFRRAIDLAIGELARENSIAVFEFAIPPRLVDEVAEAVADRARKETMSA